MLPLLREHLAGTESELAGRRQEVEETKKLIAEVTRELTASR
jgi:hypothetical protein